MGINFFTEELSTISWRFDQPWCPTADEWTMRAGIFATATLWRKIKSC